MASEKLRVLAAVDGSPQSLEVVRYVGGICTPASTEVTLFHVLSPLSESYWDTREPSDAPAAEGDLERTARRRALIERFMEEARRLLSGNGWPPEAVRIMIQPRREGVARDILSQAGRSFHAVAAGKVGHNPITRLVMGSVASKLVATLTETTLWLVEGRPENRRVLVCIDASAAAEDVVAHVARTLVASDTQITLFHAVRNTGLDWESGAGADSGKEAAEGEMKAREAMVPVFERAVAFLEAAGISSDRISVKVISGVATRGGTLYAQALHGGYGTLVVGRRGVSRVKHFPVGRVPMKLVQLMSDLAVWVVSGS